MERNVSRRQIVQALPAVAFLSAFGGMMRVLTGCVVERPDELLGRRKMAARQTSEAPTDDDEYVPTSDEPIAPVTANDKPPTLPNAAWEARAKQLEGEQARVHGAVFTNIAANNGAMAGKERSHVPQAAYFADTNKRVRVVVEHVMGKNGLPDAGGADAAEAAAPAEAGADAEGDASTADAGNPREHYVSTIYLRAIVDGHDTVVGLWEFSSDAPAPAAIVFTLPATVTAVIAYECCTLHGLWKSDALSTT